MYIDEAKISVDCELEPRSGVDYIYIFARRKIHVTTFGGERNCPVAVAFAVTLLTEGGTEGATV